MINESTLYKDGKEIYELGIKKIKEELKKEVNNE